MLLVTILALAIALPPQRVVFVGNDHLYVIGLNGKGLKQITSGPVEDHDPVWSPDGSLILFTRISRHKQGESRPDGHLFSIRPDGTHLVQLTSGPVYDSFLCWFPRDRRFTFSRQSTRTIEYVYDLKRHRLKLLSVPLIAPSWSPDRKWIAHIVAKQSEGEGPTEIWLTGSLSSKGRQLTHRGSPIDEPIWSPDGQEIAFKSERPAGANSGSEICVLNLASNKIRVIEKGLHLAIEDVRWSPNGRQLCFLESNTGLDPMTNASFRQLYVISPDGKARRRLTDHWGDDFSPQWTRDGKSILIQGERGMKRAAEGISGASTSQLILVDPTGKGEKSLPAGSSCSSISLSR